MVIVGLAATLAGIVARDTIGAGRAIASLAATYGLAVAYAGLFALQFVEDDLAGGALVALAAGALALVIGALFYGARSDNTGLTRLAYLLFSIQILALYFKTLGTLLGTALFFLLAGVLVMGLAWMAWLLHRSRMARAGA